MQGSTKRPTTTPATLNTQVDKFREAARELETDDREEAFDEKLRKIAKAPLPKDEKAEKKK